MYVAPEGKRSKTGELFPFKAGALKIATKAEAPIVVISLLNCNKIHKNFPFKRTHVYMDVINVIYSEEYETMNSVESVNWETSKIKRIKFYTKERKCFENIENELEPNLIKKIESEIYKLSVEPGNFNFDYDNDKTYYEVSGNNEKEHHLTEVVIKDVTNESRLKRKINNYDSLVLLDKFKKQPIIPVSKIELRDLPVVGPLMVNAGYLILDRDNPREAVKTFNKAQNYINNDWSDVYICPEGTRSKTGEILPFHPGSFKIAYKANCPIVVMNLTNCNKISKNLFKRKTVAIVDILDVIYPEDFKSINTSELAEKTRNMIIDFQQNN